MFIFSVFLCIGVSMASAVPDYARIEGLSFGTMTAKMKQDFRESFNTTDLVLSVILVAMVISILLYFTG
jgi:SSS family solute:Na+ symporter